MFWKGCFTGIWSKIVYYIVRYQLSTITGVIHLLLAPVYSTVLITTSQPIFSPDHFAGTHSVMHPKEAFHLLFKKVISWEEKYCMPHSMWEQIFNLVLTSSVPVFEISFLTSQTELWLFRLNISFVLFISM